MTETFPLYTNLLFFFIKNALNFPQNSWKLVEMEQNVLTIGLMIVG